MTNRFKEISAIIYLPWVWLSVSRLTGWLKRYCFFEKVLSSLHLFYKNTFSKLFRISNTLINELSGPQFSQTCCFSQSFVSIKTIPCSVIALLISIAINAYGQCPPTITADYCILGNGQVRLTATSAGATSLQWNTGQTGSVITVPGAGIYTVTANGCGTPGTINVGGDLVVNGNFSAPFDPDNPYFTSQFTYNNLCSTGHYMVTTNANNSCDYPGTTGMYGLDHTHYGATASQQFLAMNSFDNTVDLIIWQQVVNVTPNTNYYFSLWAMDLGAMDTHPANEIDMRINGVPTPIVLPIEQGNPTPVWHQYFITWPSNSYSGPVTISLTQPYRIAVGGNTGFDDISFSRLNPVPLSVAPSSNSPVCPGNTINLTANATGGNGPFTYSWSGPSGVTILNPTSPNPSASITTPGTYRFTVTVTDNSSMFGNGATNCTAPGYVDVNVTSGIENLTATATPNSICAGASINLNSSTTTTIPSTLLSENFNSPTNGWNRNGSPTWTLRPDGYRTDDRTFHSNDNSQFYLADKHNTSGTTSTYLRSPSMNTVGYTSLTLSFWHYYKDYNSTDNARVEVSTDGTSWSTPVTPDQTIFNNDIGSSNRFVLQTINLSAYINNPVLYIRFNYTSGSYTKYWAIDNVTLSGYSNNFLINWTSDPSGFTSTLANPTNVVPLVTTTYTVTYTNPVNGCSESESVTVTVNDAPIITTQPQNVSSCVGPVTFSVTASGTPTYQWYESTSAGGPWTILTNTSPYSGVTTNTLTVNPIASKDGYYYQVVLSNGSCFTTSNAALLTVTGEGPVITQQPATVSKCDGESASFTVVSNAQNFLWQYSADNGSTFIDIPTGGIYSGENSATLNISDVTGLDSYQFLCIVWVPDCGDPITSSPATLNVSPNPVINTPPESATICANSANHTFTVSASGGSGYQWQENDGTDWIDIVDGGIYSNSQTSDLTLSSIPDSYNGYQYRCVVNSSSTCSVTSLSATLSIITPPVISVQPDDQSVCEGDPATFSLTAISTGTLDYQWQIFNGSGWDNINGETNSSLTLNNTTGIGGTQYRSVVTDNCGQSVTSDVAMLNYIPPPVSAQPADAESCTGFGNFAVFTATALPGVTYQWWEYDGTSWNILNNDVWGEQLGVHSSVLQVFTPSPATEKNGRQYMCVLTSTCTYTTQPATLTVYQSPSFFQIIGDPTFCAGSSTILTADLTGPYSFLWKIYGIPISPPVTTPSIIINSPGLYSVTATDTLTGCFFPRTSTPSYEIPLADSVSVSISAIPDAPVCEGTNITFTATPTNGGNTPSYQWQVNGNPEGEDSPTFTYTPSNGDVITCVLTAKNDGVLIPCTGNTNPATSNAITVVINPTSAVGVTISANPGNSVCPGTPVTFIATPENGGTTPAYQWYNGTTPVGTNSPTYTYTPSNGDVITCVLTANNDGVLIPCTGNTNPATSNFIQISFISPTVYNMTFGLTRPLPTLTSNISYCITGSGPFIGLNGSTAGTTYTLLRDGNIAAGPITRSTSGLFDFGVRQTIPGVYKIIAELNGCIDTMRYSATLYKEAVITSHPLNQTVCLGGNTSFTVSATGVGLTYQWQVNPGTGFVDVNNGGVYSGATTATLTITGATAGMNGYIYQCIVTSGSCSPVTSSSATLMILTAPAISEQPINQQICSGSNATFTVSATGTGLTYQWQEWAGLAFNNITNGGIYSGATTSTLTLTAPPLGMSGYRYRVLISGNCSPPATSSEVTLTFFSTLVAGGLNYPDPITACNGYDSPALDINNPVITTGHGPFAYQWQSFNGSIWTDIEGETSRSYNPPNLTVPGIYKYKCKITDSCNSIAYTAEKIITINAPPTCTITGGLDAVCAGSTTTWSATAGMTSYSWTGPGGFSASTKDITIGTAGTYSVTITDANGCQSTCSRTLTVNPLPNTSLIYHQ